MKLGDRPHLAITYFVAEFVRIQSLDGRG